MSRQIADREIHKMMMSGYRHHSFDDEQKVNSMLFHVEREQLIQVLSADGLLQGYADVLAPTRLRGMKNALICLITQVCRLAIEEGVDVELSFTVSDYYINALESQSTERELEELLRQMMLHYYDIVRDAQQRCYSKPVATAVRYIGRMLYGRCSVSEVAAYVKLDPHYFSSLFKKEVGVAPARYITERKLEEARRILCELGVSVTEIADALGFSDAAHFSRRFKEYYGLPPSRAAEIKLFDGDYMDAEN